MAWLLNEKNSFSVFIYQMVIKLEIQMMDRITLTYDTIRIRSKINFFIFLNSLLNIFRPNQKECSFLIHLQLTTFHNSSWLIICNLGQVEVYYQFSNSYSKIRFISVFFNLYFIILYFIYILVQQKM